MLTGMKPVQDLDRLREVLLNQVPDPFCAVPQNDEFFSQVCPACDPAAPDELAELGCSTNIRVIVYVFGSNAPGTIR